MKKLFLFGAGLLFLALSAQAYDPHSGIQQELNKLQTAQKKILERWTDKAVFVLQNCNNFIEDLKARRQCGPDFVSPPWLKSFSNEEQGQQTKQIKALQTSINNLRGLSGQAEQKHQQFSEEIKSLKAENAALKRKPKQLCLDLKPASEGGRSKGSDR